MILAGGYPGIHNEMNISTLYTFVNGQKKYIYKDYNVMDSLYNNYRADVSSNGINCEDNMGVAYIDYDVPYAIKGDNYAYCALYIPSLTIGGAVVKKYIMTKGYNDVNINAYDNGWGRVRAEQSISVDGSNKKVVWYWTDPINNQKVALHTQNWFFEYVYNGGAYSSAWSKNGVLLQRVVDNNKEYYYMPYDDLSQIKTLEGIPSNFDLFGSLYRDCRCIYSAPQDEIYWSRETNQLLYMKDDKVRYILENAAPEGSYSWYLTVYGRYSYGYNGNKMYCKDMLTGEQTQWNGSSNNIWNNFISLYHPSAGIKSIVAGTHTYLIKFNKLNEPTLKRYPFPDLASGTNQTFKVIRLFGNTYRATVIGRDSSTSKVYIYYVDDNLNVQTITTNLPYSADNSYSIISDKYGCIIVCVSTGSGTTYVRNYYYSWDSVNFTEVANG